MVMRCRPWTRRGRPSRSGVRMCDYSLRMFVYTAVGCECIEPEDLWEFTEDSDGSTLRMSLCALKMYVLTKYLS